MQRGISFEALGKTWCLRFDVNAMCRLEAAFGGASIAAVAQRLQGQGGQPSITDLRTAYAAGLGEGVTLAEAGEVMSEIGMDTAGKQIGEAFALAFPDATDAAGAAAEPGKPKAAA